MPRPATGQIIEKDTRDGHVFALRFRAYGSRRYVRLGIAEDGWTRRAAEAELVLVLAQVERGLWVPAATEPVAEPDAPPTFHEFASAWLDARRGELAPRTIEDYTWRLSSHLLPYFARHELRSITVAAVDDYRDRKVREGVLDGGSVNKTLTLLGRILDLADERELIDRNPLRVNASNRKVKVKRKRPVWLDTAEQIVALLDAAEDLDARPTARTSGRAALLAVLVLAGLRVEEACALCWRDVDLANGRLFVRDSKTVAGVREVQLGPALRERLTDHKLATSNTAPGRLVFPTADREGRGGAQRDKDNVRSRVLVPVIARADELLAERDQLPLPDGVTAHKLRHTYASLLAALGEDPAYIMAQLGHEDPAFTMRLYTHAMRRDPGSRERLRAVWDGGSLREPERPAVALSAAST